MKKIKIYNLLSLSFFLLVSGITGFAQNQVAYSSFNYMFNTSPHYFVNGFQVKSSEGTVCNSNYPMAINYYNYYGFSVSPGNVAWPDSVRIQNAANNSIVQNRFKAVAGKPVTLTIDLYLATGTGTPNDGYYVNNINHPVEGRIGTLARTNANGSNRLYDSMVIFTRTAGPDAGLAKHYTYSGTFIFKRGSTAGYIFVTVPTTNYDGHTRYEEFIIPYLVSGALDAEVPHLGYTSEPKIPYMVLHDPPGDGSSATLSTTTQSCRSLEETYATDQSNSVFGNVKLGVKGSIGVIATVDYEIFAEFSAGATIGDIKIGSTSTENCIEISHDVTTSTLSPDANTSDLFIGYGMDMWYGIVDNLSFNGCSYTIAKSLIFQPKDGTITEFVYTKQDILDDIASQQAILSAPGLTQRDSAKVYYQIDVWNQVLALNDSNINNPDLSSAITKPFSYASTQTHSQTVSINQSHTISVEHYVDAEVGLTGNVNIAGSGFSAGYKFTTSKRFGNTSTSSTSTSQTISYSLIDDDPGDAFSVRIATDPMYGTPVFKVLPGSKSSCPYEGGIQRDQPKLEHVNTTDSLITFPNVPVGDYQSFDLKICNAAAESRAYRLRLKNNNNNAVVTAGGNAGPEFTSVSGIPLGQKDLRMIAPFTGWMYTSCIPAAFPFPTWNLNCMISAMMVSLQVYSPR